MMQPRSHGPILDGRGIDPRICLSHEMARGGLSRPLIRTGANAARKQSVAWMADVPKDSRRWTGCLSRFAE